MKLPSLVAAASALGLLAAPAAYAAPSFCTGSITTITSGTFVPGSALVGTGNCIEASDKIFGGFTVSGAITGTGSAGWLFTMPSGPADVTIGFQGLVGSSTTGSVDYQVAVDPANSHGALISALEKDFTFNSLGAGSTATLTGTVTPAPDIGAFSCTRTASSTTCPETGNFSPLAASLTVDETITTGVNTNVTALTDTVFQAVPEPASTLAFIGIMLIVFAVLHRHTARRSREAAHRMYEVYSKA